MKLKSGHINSSLFAPSLTPSLNHGYLNELFEIQEQLALAEGSLYEFFKLSWPYIEGRMPYIDSWHIRAISEHLEAVYERQIKKLIINVPPRTGKTNLISVAFPAWVWIHNPAERFLCVSCTNGLSLEHAQKNRALLESNWYQDNWGYRFPLLKDQNVKSFFQNTKTGYRQSTSVVSKTVGKGGSIIIIDDPNDPGDLSEIKRENVINWWTQRMSTRSNNPANDCRIVVQQRTHENDLTGYIRKNDSEGDWVELVLPLEFEEKRKCITVPLGIDQIIWEDPRSCEGEVLSSLRFGEKQVNELKKLLGSYGYAGQCQQRPSPIGGGIIKKKWFKFWTSPIKPKFDYILQSWDTAISDEPTAAYSACSTWGVWGEKSEDELFRMMLLSSWRDRIGYPELRSRAQRLARDYKDIGEHKNPMPAQRTVDICLIEAKATGDPLIRDLRLVTENLEPEFLNLTQEMPMEEQILPQETDDLDEPVLPEKDTLISLEDQILARLDKKGEELSPADTAFNSNFADDIPESVRDKIAAYLEEVTEKDTKNRAPWLDIIEKAKTLLGFKIEEIQDPNTVKSKSNSSTCNAAQIKTYDTTFSSSVLRLWATLRSELLPSTGPVGFRTDVSVDEDYELKGEMVRDALNEYLTVEDKGFYPDYDRFLLYLILYGCVFRKIYYDPITGKPLSRFIMPEDFLFDNNCSSITESNRLTHIRYLSKREILFNMNSGIFSKLDLNYLDNLGSSEGEETQEELKQKQVDPTGSRFPFYETHEYLVLNDFFEGNNSSEDYSIPLPYVITRCGSSNQIVSLTPNWDEDDLTKTRINCFIHYNLFPGFDVFGLGLAQILGANSKSLTSMQQMAIDAAIFQNFPGGMKSKGIKSTNNDLTILPGQFVTVETGNLSLRDSIMPLPYNGPSPALLEYINRITAQTQELASTTEAGLAENNQNTPVGTTIALLEVSNRMQSAIMRTVHSSFSQELQLFYKMFNLPSLPLDKESLKVIPVSDPSIESSTQRIIKAESILKLASSNPELHNMREVYLKVYQALGVGDIDKILLPEAAPQEQQEQPIDPALQVQIADIEQRKLEVESKERLAHLNIEADGYKTQMSIELDKEKLEQEKYLAELKVSEQQQLAEQKYQIELLKLELTEKEKVIDTLTKEQEINSKTELELLKLEYKAKEAELKAQVEALRSQISSTPTQEETIYG